MELTTDLYIGTILAVSSGTRRTAYWEWVRAQLAPVEIVSYKEIPELAKLIRRSLVQAKHCFRNAAHATDRDPRIGYVEGYASDYFPIDHAWNIWLPTGQHFDLTAEIRLGSSFRRYDAVLILEQEQLREQLRNMKFYGGHIEYTYKKQYDPDSF